ncbi:MAG: hypothetical protein K0R26_2190 [Bacteroidota bacterium]|jgi:uncharacterized protein YndB with AHSA1/START domain|nr:hypothetical protein [Bacteroidota bacterium]
MSQPVITEKTFPVPVSRVWKAITNREEMKFWYFDLAEFKAEVGFKFCFEGGNEVNTFTHECEVTEVIANKQLTYSWRYKGYEGISYVTFNLTDQGDQTLVKVTHTGLETFPPIQDFARENFVAGWTDIIGRSLKEYLEK